jgi:hypothetical protein
MTRGYNLSCCIGIDHTPPPPSAIQQTNQPANLTHAPSISFVDCQPPVNSSLTLPAFPVVNPTADQINDVIVAPHDDTHVDPSPPAEPPPSPPDPNHYDIPHSDIPPGSVLDNIMKGHNRPWSPTTPFNFSFDTSLVLCPTSPTIPDSTNDNPLPFPLPLVSVIWVVMKPRVFGIKGNSRSTVQIKWSVWSLMDAGTNICLTGDLSILADVVDIPLLPITVVLNGNSSSLDDCCTKKGCIPLTLSDGTIHWQLCVTFLQTPSKQLSRHRQFLV